MHCGIPCALWDQIKLLEFFNSTPYIMYKLSTVFYVLYAISALYFSVESILNSIYFCMYYY